MESDLEPCICGTPRAMTHTGEAPEASHKMRERYADVLRKLRDENRILRDALADVTNYLDFTKDTLAQRANKAAKDALRGMESDLKTSCGIAGCEGDHAPQDHNTDLEPSPPPIRMASASEMLAQGVPTDDVMTQSLRHEDGTPAVMSATPTSPGDVSIREVDSCAKLSSYIAECAERMTHEVWRERDQWRAACIHAKQQRDRAIFMANELLVRIGDDAGWHPDSKGPYRND